MTSAHPPLAPASDRPHPAPAIRRHGTRADGPVAVLLLLLGGPGMVLFWPVGLVAWIVGVWLLHRDAVWSEPQKLALMLTVGLNGIPTMILGFSVADSATTTVLLVLMAVWAAITVAVLVWATRTRIEDGRRRRP